MKKIGFFRLTVLLVLIFCTSCTGCARLKDLADIAKNKAVKEPYVSFEERTYNEAVDSFFAALDTRNKETIRSLFSPYIQKTTTDLDEQIDLLMKTYPGPTDICKRDGGKVHGEYSSKYGDRSSMADSSFPVVSNGTYYWCWFQLMYENDFDEEKVGINGLVLFSADYFCALQYGDDGAQWPESPGLFVCTDYTFDCEVRAIDGYPYKYTPFKRTLTEKDVLKFFKTSQSYSHFLREFGEPNAENIYYIYELSSNGNTASYLKLGIDEQKDTVYSASIVDEYGYISTLWENATSGP